MSILQVGLFGQQIVSGLGQTRLRLFIIRFTSYALFGTQANLVEYSLMALQVIFRQLHHPLAHQHIQVTLNRIEGGHFTGI